MKIAKRRFDDPFREKIIEKHVDALLEELCANGFDALGLAGGVMFHEHENTPEMGNRCHTFYIVQPDVGLAETGAFDGVEFMKDVADTMLAAARNRQS